MGVSEAYLDIETTGLSRRSAAITVVGLYLVRDREAHLLQYTGGDVTKKNLLATLRPVDTIFTYNGTRFDLPFIDASLGVDLTKLCRHQDLVYDCWRMNLYGGLKSVETRLGISRQTKGVGGREAAMLWHRYERHGDNDALNLLLRYNREDVLNLKLLRQRLAEFSV